MFGWRGRDRRVQGEILRQYTLRPRLVPVPLLRVDMSIVTLFATPFPRCSTKASEPSSIEYIFLLSAKSLLRWLGKPGVYDMIKLQLRPKSQTSLLPIVKNDFPLSCSTTTTISAPSLPPSFCLHARKTRVFVFSTHEPHHVVVDPDQPVRPDRTHPAKYSPHARPHRAGPFAPDISEDNEAEDLGDRGEGRVAQSEHMLLRGWGSSSDGEAE